MKYCEKCRSAYPDEFNVCPIVGLTSELLPGMVIRGNYLLVFRPSGADRLPSFARGLRRGLRSYAASRLRIVTSCTGEIVWVHASVRSLRRKVGKERGTRSLCRRVPGLENRETWGTRVSDY